MSTLKGISKVLDYVIYYLFFILAVAYLVFGVVLINHIVNGADALNPVLQGTRVFIVSVALAEVIALIGKLILFMFGDEE